MRVQVNGEPREVERVERLGELLDRLGVRRDGIAVARNGRVVPRTQHDDEPLAEDDEIEIIRAVAGG